MYAGIDVDGALVSLTIEHARDAADLPEIAYAAVAQSV